MITALQHAFRVGSGPNRLFRAFLWGLVGAVSLAGVRGLLEGYPPFVDLEIPLRATERWLAGEAPYLASAFAEGPDYDLPFLYPPFVLPIVAPLTLLPREIVWGAWTAVCLAAALAIVRRLGVPWTAVPLALLWPPFAEAILGGNVQLLLVAGFVVVFFGRSRAPWQPEARDPAVAERPAVVDGTLAALIPALKVSQPHAWVALLRRRPAAALAGLAVVAGVALVTLPLVGLDLWWAWVEQLQRAGDPGWELGGASLAAGLPPVVGLAIAGGTTLACLVVPLARLGAWTGILTVVGAPSLRMFGVLFALPAMLLVRREVALVAAALIASYTLEGLWLGLGAALAALALAERYPVLREPRAP